MISIKITSKRNVIKKPNYHSQIPTVYVTKLKIVHNNKNLYLKQKKSTKIFGMIKINLILVITMKQVNFMIKQIRKL